MHIIQHQEDIPTYNFGMGILGLYTELLIPINIVCFGKKEFKNVV